MPRGQFAKPDTRRGQSAGRSYAIKSRVAIVNALHTTIVRRDCQTTYLGSLGPLLGENVVGYEKSGLAFRLAIPAGHVETNW